MKHLTAISVYVCRPIITSILLLPFFFPRLFISLLSPPFFITISDHVLPLIAVSNSVTSRARVVCVSPSPPSRYHVSRVDVFVSARSACIWIRSHFQDRCRSFSVSFFLCVSFRFCYYDYCVFLYVSFYYLCGNYGYARLWFIF